MISTFLSLAQKYNQDLNLSVSVHLRKLQKHSEGHATESQKPTQMESLSWLPLGATGAQSCWGHVESIRELSLIHLLNLIFPDMNKLNLLLFVNKQFPQS